MDLRAPSRRTPVVRKMLVLLALVAIMSLAATGVAGGDRTARRVTVAGGSASAFRSAGTFCAAG
jgi:hypothetical protein